MKPVVQIALDLIEIDEALNIGEVASKAGVKWIEAGTPLIKAEGLKSVRELSENFPKNTIIADMKTMDTGSLEVEIAAEAGADIISILAAAADETISGAVKTANEYDVEIMADLIAVKDRAARAKQVKDIGVDYVACHVGIDQQQAGVDPLRQLKSMVNSVDIPIAVAGGINSRTAPKMVEAGGSIIIVGGAITKAEDISSAARDIVNAVERV